MEKILREELMYEVSTEVSFSAAHHLRNYNGPCENIHGHNWRVRAFVQSETVNGIGIAIDFRTLREILAGVVAPLDHSDLNAVLGESGLNPSSENIARMIFEKLAAALGGTGCRAHRVEVYETPTSCAAYFEHD
jgi:6-pyruvoyltetrahydropterin/6-carboxytetrahydropterin synthase